MTFDDRLRQAVDALGDHVRDDLTRELHTLAHEMTSAAEVDRADAAAAAAAAARDQARAQSDHESAARLADAVRSARTEQQTAALAASERLVDAIRAIDRARSLSEVLDTLVSCAGREAWRVAVVLVSGTRVRGWRFIGFGPSFHDPSRVDVDLADAGVIGDAVLVGDAVSSHMAPAFAELPGERDVIAVPISMSGRVVAALYADQGPTAPEARAEPTDEALHDATVGWCNLLEVMARHAARCLEALTAIQAARALIQPLDTRLGGATASPNADVGLHPTHTAEDEDAARRYAHRLVSEIKLAHEAAVVAGRRERDLTTRLGSEIERARLLYESRVPERMRRSHDYFQQELVLTLADGDPGLLGSLERTPDVELRSLKLETP